VEAMIGSGDLKPARFAKVFAIPTQSANQVKDAIVSVAEALDDARSKAESISPESADMIDIQCLIALTQLKPALIKLGHAADANPSKGIVVTDADEMGEFKLNGLVDQPYTVFAMGKIGMNAAVWFVDIAQADHSERIKLVRPQIACYDPNAKFQP
jgi:hypothetical protein